MYHIVSYAYGRFETKFWISKNNFMMVLLMDAVMGWRHGDINQRGVLCFGIGLREKEFEEEEGSELETQGKKKKAPN